MKLSVTNCPSKAKFQPLVEEAARWFAQELMDHKLLKKLTVRIVFDKTIDAHGFCDAMGWAGSKAATVFKIQINPYIGAKDILMTLAHEMTHVKQFAKNEVTGLDLESWHGEEIKEDRYWLKPYELEAYGYEKCLLNLFAEHKKLWQILDGFEDPSSPIKRKRLGMRR